MISSTRPSPRVLLGVSIFIVCYARVIADLISQWSNNAMFSYGFAVPLISGYLVWLKAEDLKKIPLRPDYWTAVPIVLLGALMLAVGTVGALAAVQGLSLVVTLTGLILLLFGRQVLRTVAFPVAYLLLMVPVWAYPLDRLQVPSQRVSAQIAVRLLDLIAIPAFGQDTQVVLPGLTLAVMRECSGINQLVALIVMVIPAGYLWLRSWTCRAVLLGLAIVVAYLSNGLRIAMIGFMASKGWRDASLSGPGHLMEGLAISVAGYLVLAACLSLLAKTERSRAARGEPGQSPAVSTVHHRPLIEIALVALMSLAALSPIVARRFEVGLRAELGSLPIRIDDWGIEAPSGLPSRFPGIEESFVGAYPSSAGERRFQEIDDELLREYSNRAGERVRLYVGYYRRQAQGKEIAGDAGHVLHSAASDLWLNLPNQTVQLREVVRREGNVDRGLLYWYDVNGRVVSNMYAAKGYTIWDALTRARTNAAVVMIAWRATAGPTSQQARLNAIAFARRLLPELRPLFPS
jgi:EpsI family protein